MLQSILSPATRPVTGPAFFSLGNYRPGLWVDFKSQTPILDSGNATRFTDQSGNGYVFEPDSTRNPGEWKPAERGVECVRSNAEGYVDTSGSSTAQFHNGPGTWFYVAKISDIDATGYLLCTMNGGAGNRGFALILDDRQTSNSYTRRLTFVVSNGSSLTVNTTVLVPNAAFASGDKVLVIVRYDGSGYELRLNRYVYKIDRTLTPSYSSTAASQVALGVNSYNASSSTMGNVTLYEFGFVPRYMGNDDIEACTLGLGRKWSIPGVIGTGLLRVCVGEGQSNWRGKAPTSAQALHQAHLPNVYFNRKDSGDVTHMMVGLAQNDWVIVDPGDPFTLMGPWATWGQGMASYWSDAVLILMAGTGGKGLADADGFWPGQEGVAHTQAKHDWQRCLNKLERLGIHYSIEGFAFVGCENDMIGQAAAEAVQDNIEGLIADVRSFFGKSALPTVLHEPYGDDDVGAYPYRATVASQLQAAAAADANVVTAVGSPRATVASDNIHLNYASQDALGDELTTELTGLLS